MNHLMQTVRGGFVLKFCASFARRQHLVAVVLLLLCGVDSAFADRVIRFGTGGSDGSYFPVGSLIATEVNKIAVSNGTDPQSDVDGPLVLLPQRSNGSVANIKDLSDNLLEIGLVQADVASLAYKGKGQFENDDLQDTLRTIGTLYQESVHLVVAADSDINGLSDLKGKRLSVDELGSGTQFDAERILLAGGVQPQDIKTIYLKPSDSIERMRRGLLDAIFIVSGYPVAGVKQLVEDGVGRVVGLSDDVVTQMTNEYLYFSAHDIPANVYSNAEKIRTLSVSAQMIVRADVSEDIVYEITRILWSDSTVESLAAGHPRGVDISADTALQGIAIPLHEGALRYYVEQGYNTQTLPKRLKDHAAQ